MTLDEACMHACTEVDWAALALRARAQGSWMCCVRRRRTRTECAPQGRCGEGKLVGQTRDTTRHDTTRRYMRERVRSIIDW